jgi:hypothetical protein
MRPIKQKDDVPHDTTQGYGFAKIETLHKMSIAITAMLSANRRSSQKFHKTQNLSSLYREEKEKEKLELKRTLLGQPSPFPFGISSKKKT